MNKADVISHMASEADITKATANRALDALIEGIIKSLKNGDPVTLIGFGTFDVSQRAERQGRNPRTGEAITIKAATLPRFKAGKALKDAVNQ